MITRSTGLAGVVLVAAACGSDALSEGTEGEADGCLLYTSDAADE